MMTSKTGKRVMKPGDLVEIDYRLPFKNEIGIGLIVKIEESSMMAYILSSFGTRWEFMTNLTLIEILIE